MNVSTTSAAFDEFGAVIVNAAESAQQQIINSSATKSDKIRQLLATGMKRGDVAKALNIRYQHVRNVEITPIKRK